MYIIAHTSYNIHCTLSAKYAWYMKFYHHVYPNDPHVQTTVTIITDHVPHPPWKLIATLNYVLGNRSSVISHTYHQFPIIQCIRLSLLLKGNLTVLRLAIMCSHLISCILHTYSIHTRYRCVTIKKSITGLIWIHIQLFSSTKLLGNLQVQKCAYNSMYIRGTCFQSGT